MSQPKFSIFIERFRVEAFIAAASRCGGYDRGFDAQINITVDSLDDSGFVIENEGLVEKLQMQFAFGTTKAESCGTDRSIWKASCEQLTAGIANVIATLIPKERLIALDIQVFNQLGFTRLQWDMGDTIPEFPRLATKEEIRETQRQNRELGIASVC